MADEYLKDKRGIRYGKISTDMRGNITYYNKTNIKIGTIKTDSLGKQTAYDKSLRPVAVYDPRTDTTKDRMGRRLSKGNTLVDLFFAQIK